MDDQSDFWATEATEQASLEPQVTPAAVDQSRVIIATRGTAWMGPSFWLGVSGAWPFGRLIVRERSLTLSLFGQRFQVSKECVSAIHPVGIFGNGFRIQHDDASAPQSLIFWCLRPALVRRALAEVGYPLV